jgi:NADPH-dependent ferric siderophore reductase
MNMLKKKALQLIERQLGKKGIVLEVRSWNPSTFYEVDLHLPGVDMDKWTSVQHMKTKDYTPASWDVETQTCTLYIDASHDGDGSKWVAQLRKGDQICYLGIGGTNAKPVDGKQILCLGDSSCVGHFLALEQLVGKGNIAGALVIKEENHRAEFASYFDTLLEAIPPKLSNNIDNLHNWLKEQQWGSNAIYIAGNVPMVVGLKQKIRSLPDFDAAVKVQGFWW